MQLRPTACRIVREALAHNFRKVQEQVGPRVGILAVAKADAYGHGASLCVPVFQKEGAALIGVATVEEAVALRAEKFPDEILVLGSLWPFDSFEVVCEERLIPTIGSFAAFRALEKAAERRKMRVPCHLKVDTGFGRIGLIPATAFDLARQIHASRWVELQGIYSHLSCAETDPEHTRLQIAAFESLLARLETEGIRPRWVHLANSTGALEYPAARFNLVRPGLALYGVAPSLPGGGRASLDLKPAMRWTTQIIFLKHVPSGVRISYGGTFVTRRPSRIATLAVGYADGYPRRLSNRAKVLIHGRRVPVVGMVCMDMAMVDVTDLPEAQVGDEAVLLGRQEGEEISAEEVASWAETIPYEIFCGISKRVPRLAA